MKSYKIFLLIFIFCINNSKVLSNTIESIDLIPINDSQNFFSIGYDLYANNISLESNPVFSSEIFFGESIRKKISLNNTAIYFNQRNRLNIKKIKKKK